MPKRTMRDRNERLRPQGLTFSTTPVLRHAVALAALLAISASCKRTAQTEKTSSSASSTAAETRAPVPPPHLLASGVIVSPTSLFDRVKGNVQGTTALFFPSTVSALLERTVNLDHRVGNELDLGKPVRFAWAGQRTDGKAPTFFLSLAAKDAAAASRLLAESRAGAAASGGLAFPPKKEGEPSYFIKGSTVLLVNGPVEPGTDLSEVVRFLEQAKAEKQLFFRTEGEGLHDFLVPLALARWSEMKSGLEAQAAAIAKEKKRAADYGDPTAILSSLDVVAKDRAHALSELASIEVAVTLDELSSLEARFEPKAKVEGDSPPPTPLFDAPGDAALALLFRSSEGERAETKKRVVELLGGGAVKADASAMAQVASSFLEGRGDEVSLSFHPPPYEGVFLRTRAKDSAKLEKAFTGFSDLATKSPIRDVLSKRFGEISGVAIGTQKADTGPVHVASFVAKSPFALAFAKVGDDEIATLGPSATKLLEWAAKPARRLKDDFVLKPEETWARAPSSFALLFRRSATDAASTTNVRFAANYGQESGKYRLTIAADAKLLNTILAMALQ